MNVALKSSESNVKRECVNVNVAARTLEIVVAIEVGTDAAEDLVLVIVDITDVKNAQVVPFATPHQKKISIFISIPAESSAFKGIPSGLHLNRLSLLNDIFQNRFVAVSNGVMDLSQVLAPTASLLTLKEYFLVSLRLLFFFFSLLRHQKTNLILKIY